ncbi:TetR/AcrR family transcriptional regulator [Demequina sp. NBRC 110054]|uniref:TetR/AcrR family transcriptional regulator n=1 Tax=Demequina sp. NBRC 110054 TaxID=1570343 RepID=UPI001F44591F|nr:TetR/AcrR family transcriptional regulator C-terminal domain-containing protein [Demequina sp. NBRC 110054]
MSGPGETAREPLSRDRIVQAAVAIADFSGLRAVTMRGVADELDCEAMSLYHHVAKKPDLMAAMVEAIVGEVAVTQAAIREEDWRDTFRARCLAARGVMLAHPWAPALISEQTQSPAAMFALYEDFLATLIDAGFDYGLAHRAIHSIGSLILGFSNELFDPAPDSDEEIDEEAMLAMAAQMPHLLQMAATGPHDPDGSLSACDTRAEFVFTLDLILDGLEARRAALR